MEKDRGLGSHQGHVRWKRQADLDACPVQDCNIPVDIQLKSADGVVFGSHQRSLDVFSNKFPTAAAPNIVQLQETANVLQLMLMFMHNTRLPELHKFEFKTIVALAEAAEKYSICSAMEVCRAHIEKVVEQHPVDSFLYSAKHGYSRLADRAAYMTLGLPATTFFLRAEGFNLSHDPISKWYRFRERWMDILFRWILVRPSKFQQHNTTGFQTCELWPQFHLRVVVAIGRDLTALSHLSEIVGQYQHLLDSCENCLHNLQWWASQIHEEVLGLPRFTMIDSHTAAVNHYGQVYIPKLMLKLACDLPYTIVHYGQQTMLRWIRAYTSCSISVTPVSGLDPEEALCPVKKCNIPVDVKLKSKDGIIFGGHQTNLGYFSERFPVACSTIVDEIIPLQENADVLYLMLKFMHNTRLPELKKVKFSTISALAEAVEKYVIYSAMEICRAHMEWEIENHPLDVFMYSAKHGYSGLADQSARMTLNIPVTRFFQRAQEYNFRGDLILKWYRFRECWMDVLFRLVLSDSSGPQQHGGSQTCQQWSQFQLQVIIAIKQDLTQFSQFSDIMEQFKHLLKNCKYCLSNQVRWISRVQREVEGLPSFTNA